MSVLMDENGDLNARVANLRRAYEARIPDLVRDLQVAVQTVEQADAEMREVALERVRRRAHQTAGTAATYGLHDFANAHRHVERATKFKERAAVDAALRNGLADIQRIAAVVTQSQISAETIS